MATNRCEDRFGLTIPVGRELGQPVKLLVELKKPHQSFSKERLQSDRNAGRFR